MFKIPHDLVNKAKPLRQHFSQQAVWIASSTHEAEESLVIATAIALKKRLPNTLCIIAPRHPERFAALAEKCLAQGLTIARYSQKEAVTAKTDILLADTLGELYFFYALADVALVCGSFANIGGHNILEPASLGLPIIVGPVMFNFKTILADFLKVAALQQVENSEGLLPALLHLLNDKSAAKQMGQRARDLVQENQGAADKIMLLLPTTIR